MKLKLLSRQAKVRIYQTIVRPIVCYVSETWTLTKRTEKRLITFENKVLRRIYGPICENRQWRIRKNRELRQLYTSTDIVACVRTNRLRWYGHVMRRSPETTIKAALEGNVEGTRPLGRPRTRWRDNSRRDMAILGLGDGDAANRERWKAGMSEAKDRLRFVWLA